MPACCIFVAFVIFILFSSNNSNTQHVAFGGMGGHVVDILCKLLDKISMRWYLPIKLVITSPARAREMHELRRSYPGDAAHRQCVVMSTVNDGMMRAIGDFAV